jgi:glycosyltransferase involved in cell wall biosynthesis
MPVYNCEAYVTCALNSVANQTYKHFEILIVDDGSLDSSVDKIGAFIKGYPSITATIIVNPLNMGEGYSRNVGIDNSKGRYICFLDADDEYEPEFISVLYSKIKGGYDFVYCGYDTIYSDTETIPFLRKRKYQNESRQIIRNYLFAKNHFAHTGAIYCKKYLSENFLQYNLECSFGADVEFVCELLLSNPRCSSVDKSLYRYYIRPRSMSTGLTTKKIEDCLSALKRIQAKIPGIINRLYFLYSRRSNTAFHLIEESYRYRINPLPSGRSKWHILLLGAIQVFFKPTSLLRWKSARAFWFFTKN